MNIGKSISTCFKKYVTFKGRATRSEFWWFWFFNLLVGIVLVFISPTLSDIFQLALLLPQLAVGVRRMHDTNHSGWWILCPIANLVFTLTESDKRDNDYGPKPED